MLMVETARQVEIGFQVAGGCRWLQVAEVEGGSLKAEAAKVANPPDPPPLRRDPTFVPPPTFLV